nr:uncharacterized protein LOC122174339 [Chrysemys picta bellii]
MGVLLPGSSQTHDRKQGVSYDPSKNSSHCPLPIRAQHHHPISPSARQKRPSLTKNGCFRNRGKAERKHGLLHHPRENFRLCFSPKSLRPSTEKALHRDSSKEGGVAKGSPLAQPLMEPESETQLLVRYPNEHGGLSSSTRLEEEGERSSGESLVDKVNGKDIAQFNDAFPEDLEALHSVASDSEAEPGLPCFCSMLIQIVVEDSEGDSYEEAWHGTN